MKATKRRELPKPEDAGDDYKPQYESYQELETVNSITPIWHKRSSEVSQEDYNEFYKATFHDFADPARTISFHAEGRITYDALLFVPSARAVRPLQQGLQEGPGALPVQRAHSGKVRGPASPTTTTSCAASWTPPTYRSTSRARRCSRTRSCSAIARQVEKKIHADLLKMASTTTAQAYEKFFANFGRGLKFGIYASYGMMAGELADLHAVLERASEGKLVTLEPSTSPAWPRGRTRSTTPPANRASAWPRPPR